MKNVWKQYMQQETLPYLQGEQFAAHTAANLAMAQCVTPM